MNKQVLAGLAAALAASLCVISTPAAAADKGIYLGASAGLSGLHDDVLDYDADATGFKLIAGCASSTGWPLKPTMLISARQRHGCRPEDQD